jgi:hypothetical protein
MVWSGISSKGVVHLEILNGIQNAQKYRDLLIRVKPIIERTMDPLPWLFSNMTMLQSILHAWSVVG